MPVYQKSKVNYKKQNRGFTIMEVIVGLAIFAILATAMINSFMLVSKTAKTAREKIILSNLSINYLEIVRNMPYSQVGTLLGNPHGNLPDLPDAFTQKIGAYTYKIYYKVTYVHDPADTTSPGAADYKQVKMSILNNSTGQITDFVTTVVPKGIISNPNTGALQVTVINSQGQPLSGISVQILYPTSTPYTYNLMDTTNSSGQVTEVGLPAGVNAYRIIATATGYSTDSTIPITSQNPNPVHPDATVVNGQVTQLTLSIDTLSNLNIKTLDQFCQYVSGVNLNISGIKLIGVSPNVYKFNQNFSSVNGLITLTGIEWDTYTPILLTGQSWVVLGTSPIQKIDVLPGTTQTFTILLDTNSTGNSLRVIVKDAATGTALENATVHLHKGGSVPQDYYGTTGGSVWLQSDWSGGSDQVQYSSSTPNKYFQDSGTVDANSAPTGLRLLKLSGRYQSSGWAESSTFDTGTASTGYTILSWQPTSQSSSTSIAFQIAANNDGTTWNYLGPDGTSATYFTTPGEDIGSIFDNKRYVRYKVFLATTDDKITPVLSSVNLNFVTGCFTPGQTFFNNLTLGNNYSLTVSLPGYTDNVTDSLNISGNQTDPILMSP